MGGASKTEIVTHGTNLCDDKKTMCFPSTCCHVISRRTRGGASFRDTVWMAKTRLAPAVMCLSRYPQGVLPLWCWYIFFDNNTKLLTGTIASSSLWLGCGSRHRSHFGVTKSRGLQSTQQFDSQAFGVRYDLGVNSHSSFCVILLCVHAMRAERRGVLGK